MKSVSLKTQLFMAPWDRKQTRNPRHITMKGGVEAGDLRKMRIPLREPLDEFDLTRKMFRIIGAQPLQLAHHSRCQRLRGTIARAAMHHSMPDGDQWMVRQPVSETAEQGLDAGGMVRHVYHLRTNGTASFRCPSQGSLR